MENKNWSREEAEKNKNTLLEELKKDPQNGLNLFADKENLKWVEKELNTIKNVKILKYFLTLVSQIFLKILYNLQIPYTLMF